MSAPGGQGVHRSFYNGGRYAYITGCDNGYESFILRIIDLADPTHPVEAGRYCVPEQIIQGESDLQFGDHLFKPFVHAVTVKDDIAYLAYSNVGFVLVDVSDKANPKMIGKLPAQSSVWRGCGRCTGTFRLSVGRPSVCGSTTEGERSRFFTGKKTEGFGKKIEYQAMNAMMMSRPAIWSIHV